MSLRVTEAWLNRKADPETFNQTLKKLSRKFYNEIVKPAPDRQATEDRELVTASMRGASGRVPEEKPPDFARMTDADFATWKDQNFSR
jgi:hypothetical protein